MLGTTGSCGVVDKRGRGREELSQGGLCYPRDPSLGQRLVQQRAPPVARRPVDGKRVVAHAEPGMAAPLDVPPRPAEPPHEKLAQPPLGVGQISPLIHRAQNLVTGGAPVERRHEPGKSFVADQAVNVSVEQVHGRGMLNAE